MRWECSTPSLRPALAERVGLDRGGGGRTRHTHRGVARPLGGDDDGAPLGAGCHMVTEADVWAGARRGARPRDPCRLPRRARRRPRRPRRRRPRPRRLHADLSRLPGARGHARRDGRAHRRARPEPDVETIRDDSVVDRPHHPAGREKLREAGFAPPAPRAEATTLVQLQTGCVPLPLLRLSRHAAREHLRPDTVPLDPLLQRLPPAVRAVQDALSQVPCTPMRLPSPQRHSSSRSRPRCGATRVGPTRRRCPPPQWRREANRGLQR